MIPVMEWMRRVDGEMAVHGERERDRTVAVLTERSEARGYNESRTQGGATRRANIRVCE